MSGELRAKRRGNPFCFPGKDHTVLTEWCNKNDRRIRRDTETGFADQSVHFLQLDGLQSCGKLAAELVECITAFLGGPSLSQFRFLADDAHRQCDQDGGWNENPQNEKEDPAIA